MLSDMGWILLMPEPMTEQELADAEEYLGIQSQICNALIDEVRRLRDLHADALRQITLIQEKRKNAAD